MTESEVDGRVTAHRHGGALELRSGRSPDAWILAGDPVCVER